MHPLDRVRQVASYALAALLVLNACFAFAMTALSTVRAASGAPGWDWGTTAFFAALTVLFVGTARFFAWFGRGPGRQ